MRVRVCVSVRARAQMEAERRKEEGMRNRSRIYYVLVVRSARLTVRENVLLDVAARRDTQIKIHKCDALQTSFVFMKYFICNSYTTRARDIKTRYHLFYFHICSF